MAKQGMRNRGAQSDYVSVDSVFARKTSGIVRSMNFRDVLCFNLLGYGVGLSLATNPAFLGVYFPGANVLYALCLGAILSIAFGFTHGALGSLYPAQGGELRFFFRVGLPRLGFISNFLFTASQIFGAGVFAYWAITQAIAPTCWYAGILSGRKTWLHIGNDLNSGIPAGLCSIIWVTICCGALLLFRATILRLAIYAAVAIGLLSSTIMIVSFWGEVPQRFRADFNDFEHRAAAFDPLAMPGATDLQNASGGSPSNSSFIAAASPYDEILGKLCSPKYKYSSADVEPGRSCKFSPSVTSKDENVTSQLAVSTEPRGGFVWPLRMPTWNVVGLTANALPIAFLVFFGFSYSVYVGGEVQDPARNQQRGVRWAFLVALIVSLVGFMSYYRAIGAPFHVASSLYAANNLGPLMPFGNSMILMAAVPHLLPAWLVILMGFGNALWFLLLPFVMIRMCIANVFAWSTIAGVLPRLSKVSEKFNQQPILAIIPVWILVVACIVWTASNRHLYLNYTLLFSASFCVTCFATAFMPYWKRTREEYSRGLFAAKFRTGAVPWITVAGVVSGGLFAGICFVVLRHPALSAVTILDQRIGPLSLCILIVVAWILWHRYTSKDRQVVPEDTSHLKSMPRDVEEEQTRGEGFRK